MANHLVFSTACTAADTSSSDLVLAAPVADPSQPYALGELVAEPRVARREGGVGLSSYWSYTFTSDLTVPNSPALPELSCALFSIFVPGKAA